MIHPRNKLVHYSTPSLLTKDVFQHMLEGPANTAFTPDDVDPREVDPSRYSHHCSVIVGDARWWFFTVPEAAAQFKEDQLNKA